ncbi:MAG: NACHT domain-containing protein, partial [Rubrivivax sp.]|nr:NACHT domain-containing protein [Rubrivivax sp.]
MAHPTPPPGPAGGDEAESPRAGAEPPGAATRWQVRLLGTVEASDGTQTLQRFPSRAVAALLARLACSPEQAHAREELVELLWPGVEAAVGRNRLRQALSTLKSLLESAGGPGAAVLLADRMHVRVAPGALGSDVHSLRRLARAGRAAEAHALYRGEFMPGFYEEWIDETRLELAALEERLAQRLQRAEPAAPPPPQAAAPARASASASAAAAASASASAPASSTASTTASPAPAPLATRTQLPHYLTRLFGAEAAVAALREQVLEHRLVSLIGPGGSGKTRLAVEAAHALAQARAAAGGAAATANAPAPRFDLVVFVPLAACTNRGEALDAVLGALRLATAADAVEAVAEALQGRRALLLLDNFEQLVESARDAVALWLAELPQLHVLVTSRRPLALDGEREVAAEVLPLPPPQATLAEAAANPAVALFVERARAARADFHLGERNAPVLAALVRALEGMPLALELAASRVRSIAPAEMLERLRGPGAPRLELLARSGPRGAFDARHASMQRVIAWSWNQLSPAQRQWLSGLTVFPGGFTAPAALVLAEAFAAND